MYLKYIGAKPLGCNMVEIHEFLPQFMVKNKLSRKPQEAANVLKKIIEGRKPSPNGYDMSIEQDWSRGVVRLNLLSQDYTFVAGGGRAKGCDEHGQYIYRSTELPITAAIKRYKQVAQQMINDTNKERNIIV